MITFRVMERLQQRFDTDEFVAHMSASEGIYKFCF